ncbi:hypothetical protein NEI07_09900, partial [Methylocystis sp. NLS-7]|nr:hypothetical protein [Methylocystis suflitae]
GAPQSPQGAMKAGSKQRSKFRIRDDVFIARQAWGNASEKGIAKTSHAITLLIAWRLMDNLEQFPDSNDMHLALALCPLDVSPFDFSALRYAETAIPTRKNNLGVRCQRFFCLLKRSRSKSSRSAAPSIIRHARPSRDSLRQVSPWSGAGNDFRRAFIVVSGGQARLSLGGSVRRTMSLP